MQCAFIYPSPLSHPNKPEIRPLTAFRFITAFVVFLFHCKIHLDFSFGIKLIDKFINNGAVFMTGFFIMSGYVMCYVYGSKDFSQKKEIINFYIKRFAKIYPTYLTGSIIYFIFIKPENSYSIQEWIRITLNDILLVQSFFPKMFELGINSGTWSISVEAFFYLLFPLIIVLFLKRPFTLLLLGLLMSLVININTICDTASGGYYANPIMRINEFVLGIAFYQLHSKGKLENIYDIFKSPLILFAIIFILTTLKQSDLKYSYMGLHILIIPCFCLLLNSLEKNKSILWNNNIINYLGKVSYSFYIWQFIAIEFGKFLRNNILSNSWTVMLSVLILNIFLASLSYFLIEERFRKLIIKNY